MHLSTQVPAAGIWHRSDPLRDRTGALELLAKIFVGSAARFCTLPLTLLRTLWLMLLLMPLALAHASACALAHALGAHALAHALAHASPSHTAKVLTTPIAPQVASPSPNPRSFNDWSYLAHQHGLPGAERGSTKLCHGRRRQQREECSSCPAVLHIPALDRGRVLESHPTCGPCRRLGREEAIPLSC